jgi:hypothetical protein
MAILKLKNGQKNGAAASTPALPSAADLDAVAEEQKAKEATAQPAEQSTPPAIPEVPEQGSAAGFAPDSIAGPASFLSVSDKTDWSDPDRDTTKQDSLGNVKSDQRTFGPKGAAVPPDGQTPDERQSAEERRDAKMREHMPSTVGVDSIGRPKGHFRVIPQGYDRHGARIPDKVDTSQPIEPPPAHVGPRGSGAPADSFHGARPKR